MNMKKALLGLGTNAVILASLIFSGQLVGQSQGNTILSAKITHDIEFDGSPVAALEQILQGTGVSGGVVQVSECSSEPKLHLKMHAGSSLEETMQALVKGNPTYKWEVKDRVVDLLPENGIPELLNTHVGHFDSDIATDNLAPFSVLNELSNLPEVRLQAERLGMSTSGFFGCCGAGTPGVAAGGQEQKSPVKIRISELSLRDAFDSVVRSYGHYIWVYTESQCKGKKTYYVGISWD